MSATPFCAEVARAAGDDLAGTASRASTWVAVEHPGTWGRRAVEEDPLPAPLREWVDAVGRQEGVRVVLVARPAPASRERREVRVATCGRGGGEAGRLDFAPGGAPDLDPARAGRWLAEGDLEPHRGAFFLVCVNARRDRCCARFGVATAAALAEAGLEVWQSTHLGGHRYAATALQLPAGVAYGFLRADDAPRLARATADGTLLLDRYRGRVVHPRAVQAADVLLRRQRGWRALDAVTDGEATALGDGRWRVELASAAGERHAVGLREGSKAALVGCSAAKEKDIETWALEEATGPARGDGHSV